MLGESSTLDDTDCTVAVTVPESDKVLSCHEHVPPSVITPHASAALIGRWSIRQAFSVGIQRPAAQAGQE